MPRTDKVLVIPSGLAPRDLTGAWCEQFLGAPELECCEWLARPEAENDERYLQIIPYAILQNASGDVWCYQRAGGDSRLLQRLSCGVGGHVEARDEALNFLETVRNSLQRELIEELGFRPLNIASLAPSSWVFEGLSQVGRVHLGLVFALDWTEHDDPQPIEKNTMISLGFRPRTTIVGDSRFELWSRLALSRDVKLGEST